jgi:uncharacterized protein YndB with AHSA1/START domain
MTSTEISYRRPFVVRATPERAFEEYTAARGGWWPHDHQLGELPVLGIGFDPRVGGEWYERAIDGSRVKRGEIVVWEPPHRLVVTWPLGDPDVVGSTEFELRFVAHGEGTTRVELEHRHLERTTMLDLVVTNLFSAYGWDLVVHNFSAYLASEPWR